MYVVNSGSAAPYIIAAVVILILTFLPTIIAFIKKNRRVKVLLMNIAQTALILISFMIYNIIAFIMVAIIILVLWICSFVLAIKKGKGKAQA